MERREVGRKTPQRRQTKKPGPLKYGTQFPFTLTYLSHWMLNTFGDAVGFSYGRGRREWMNQQKETNVSSLGHSLPLFTASNALTKPCMFCLVVSFQKQDTDENTPHQGEPLPILLPTPSLRAEISRKPHFGCKTEWGKAFLSHSPGRLKWQEWWWGRGVRGWYWTLKPCRLLCHL